MAARLLFTVAGGLLVWTWAAPPASARQVTVAPARRVDRSVDVQPAAAVAVAPAARVSGNVANTD
ncbi:MAG: hypothetical protein U0P30_01135 [Vicinamibacterales bacterium]